jgi:hypothetical protein
MDLEGTNARNNCAGEDHQQFNRQTDSWSWSWQLEVSPPRELVVDGSTSGSQRSEYEDGVRRSPPCEDVSPEAEERPPLKAVTKQRDWWHKSVCDTDLWSVVTSCKIVH